MLKWTGALAAAAVAGGIAEYGASELLKPPPTPPPPPISLKPPLSPEIQQRVDAIVNTLISNHADEKIVNSDCKQNGRCYGPPCTVRYRVKNGVLVGAEVDDIINPNMGREDAYISEEALKLGLIQNRPCQIPYAMRAQLYRPGRITYPLKQIGGRGSEIC